MDDSDHEFALAPSGYAKYGTSFPNGVNYTVGTSTSADWSYIQPGPDDAWSGSASRTFTISYALTAAQAATDQILQLNLLDTNTSAPTLDVHSNGTDVGSTALPAGGGVGAFGAGTSSGVVQALTSAHQVGMLIPHADLRTGSNSLTITPTAGSWAVYDAVTMVPGPPTEATVQVLSETPTPLIEKSGTLEEQLVDVGIYNTSSTSQSVTLTASTSGVTGSTTTTVAVPAGRSTQRIPVPAIPQPAAGQQPSPAELDITSQSPAEAQPTTYAMNLQYQERWQLDLLNGSHLDIGYHYDQATTRQLQDDYLDQAVTQCQATRSYSDNAKYRWMIESAWVLDNYLHDRTAGQIASLASCISSGQIEITAGYDNNLQDLGNAEQLIRSLTPATETFAAKFGVKVTSAIQDDVSGVTAQYIQMLHQHGVNVLINGSNPYHTGRQVSSPGATSGQDVPTLFNWKAPDGSKVLSFFGSGVYDQGYRLAAGHGLNQVKCLLASWPDSGSNAGCSPSRPSSPLPYSPIPAPSAATISTVVSDFASGLTNYLLPGLQAAGYPQSVYPLSMVEDSTPPIAGLSDVVKSFNTQYEWPKLSISTPSRYRRDATTASGTTSPDGYTPDALSTQASALPTRSGDYTGWWSDGAGSSAFETAENDEAQARTQSADTLAALGTLQDVDPTQSCLVNRAFQQSNLYTEHTWGSPDPVPTDSQWPPKKATADTAASDSTAALASATSFLAGQVSNASSSPGIVVLNPDSWARTDVVTAVVPSGWAGKLVDSSTSGAIAYQSVDATHIQFIATAVSSDGYRVYQLQSGTNTAAILDASLTWNPTTGVLANSDYKVSIAANGTISSIVNVQTNHQLVDSSSAYKLNQYIYRAPNGTKWSPTTATVAEGANGPISITVKVTDAATLGGKDASGNATGIESASASITLYANTSRIDIANTINKTQVTTAGEQGFFAFPFNESHPTVTYETPGTPTQLGAGQMPGSSMNYQSMGSYADISTGTDGVTFSSADAPLVEFGSLRTDLGDYAGSLTQRPGRLDDNVTPDLSGVLPTNGSAFSYLFNNVTDTNYRLAQSGPVTFHYSITDHANGFKAANATNFGWGVQQPLQAAPVGANQTGAYTTTSASLASLDATNTTIEDITQPTPAQLTAGALPLTVRLLEVAGASATVHLTVPYAVTSAQLEDLNGAPLANGTLTVSTSNGTSVITVPVSGHGIVTLGLNPTTAVHASPETYCDLGGTFTVGAKDTSGSLKVRTWNLTGWSDWTDLGGPTNGTFTGTPAVISEGGTTYVFVRGTDNALWQRTYVQSGTGWGSWTSLGGGLGSSPAAAIDPATGSLTVFVMGADNPAHLYWRTWTPAGWSAWDNIAGPTGGTFTRDPSVTMVNGRYDVFVEGTDNALWTNTFPTGGTAWAGWTSLGGSLTGSPSATYNSGNGDYTVFLKGADSPAHLYWKTWTPSGGWSDWNNIAGPTGSTFVGAPAATTANGRLDVFAQGTDGAIWQNTYPHGGTDWGGWTSLAGTVNASPGAAYDGNVTP